MRRQRALTWGLGWLLLWGLIHGAATATPLELERDQSMRFLRGHLAVWFDPTHARSFAEIRRLPLHAFTPLATDLSPGFVDAVAWLRFEVVRPAAAPAEWWLRVGPQSLDRLELYAPNPMAADGYERRILDLRRPWSARLISSPLNLFPLHLDPDAPAVFYLRVANATSVNAYLSLWQPAALMVELTSVSLIFGGYLLTALVIVLINLFHWASLRQPVFVIYAGYVAFMALHAVQLENLHLFLLQPETPLPVKPLMALTQAMHIWFAYAFFAALVRPERYWPRLAWGWRRLHGGVLLAAIGLILAGQLHGVVLALWLWALLTLAVQLTAAAGLGWRQRDRLAFYYLLTFTGLILAAALRVSLQFGWIETFDLLVEPGPLLGSMLHWVLIQIIVLDILHRARRAHEAARDQALAVAQRGEAELEAQVQARTQQLEKAQNALSRALAEEQQALQDQRRFLRMVAHEFRTPLATLCATGALLEELEAVAANVTGPTIESDHPALRRRSLERLQGAVGRLTQLVDGALALDRFEDAAWRAVIAPVDLAELFRQVAVTVSQGDGEAHPLSIECPALTLRADRELCRIALHNLLDNACKYSPPGRPIALSATPDGAGVVIRVHDQGPGLASAEQRRIFDKYYRTAAAHAAPGSGLGLGLYLVERIARLHGGRVGVDSTPGQGCCFSLYLPDAPRRNGRVYTQHRHN